MKKSKASRRGGGGGGIEMISDLPDPILYLILSGLPTTEEAVRTSILSTRWRYLWTSLPSLDIDSTRGLKPSVNFKKNKFKEFVYWVLVNKTLDLDSFRLRCASDYNMSTVWRWIHAAVMRKVKLLDLSFFPRVDDEDFKLPHSLVTCDSLEVLRLFLYERSLVLPTATGFPALRVLELNSIELLDHNSVQEFFKSCPLLEDLSLIDCFSYTNKNLCISCLNLKSLRIHNWTIGTYAKRFGYGSSSDNDGLCFCLQICCPKLVFFEYAGHSADAFSFENLDSLKKAVIYPDGTVSLFGSIGANICQLFAGVSHVESLSLNLFSLKVISLARDAHGAFPTSLPNLKTLEISTTIEHYTMTVVMRILRCCPNLESFHLIVEEEILWPQVLKFDEFLACHLKRVEFLEFHGEKRKVDMARFLLEHGNELEEMVFSWHDKVNYHEKSTDTMKEVSKFYKASSTVKLITLLKD
ncbi:putative FBD domain, leucine-rich repeat domain superfamily, F-box-like domain superfamily [Helianthus annuus]|nr:putative FBD domain, leucine-rich repeat domain superfamily, F-box-like domain superfamily [Helianthus annuus]